MGRAKSQRTRYPWRKQAGWFIQTLESGTQYRARHESLGAKRQLVLFRRPTGGNLEQVATVAADDLVSCERAALADDLKRTSAAVTRCSCKVDRKAAALDDARAACDLVRDDLRRLSELAPKRKQTPVPVQKTTPRATAKATADKPRLH